MKPALSAGEAALPPDLAQRLDPVCDAFEAAWKAARCSGAHPRIEDFLGQVPAPARPLLLRELVLAEAHYRQRLGERPEPEEYQARFPDLDPGWLAGAVLPEGPSLTRPSLSSPAH